SFFVIRYFTFSAIFNFYVVCSCRYLFFNFLCIFHSSHPLFLTYVRRDKFRTNYSADITLSSRTTSYNVVASSFFTCSFTCSTFTVKVVCPKYIVIKSPTSIMTEGFATWSFTLILPCSAISFANGRRLIIRDTFKNLSKRIFIIPLSLLHSKNDLAVLT